MGLDNLGCVVEKPRVVHVTTAHAADDVRIFERECRSLAATGHYEVYLAASGSIPTGEGVTLIPLERAPKSRARRFSVGSRKGRALASVLAADLWHFHDPELLPVALKLARSGRRVIWDAHEDYVEQFTRAGAKSWVPGPVRGVVRAGTQALLRQVDRHAAGIVAATPIIASRYSNPHTVLVGNEARLEQFSNCRPDFGSRQVLFTGIPAPGHLFLEVAQAVAQIPGVRLAVAGRDPEPGTWAKAEAILGERLIHLGWLDRVGLASAMNSSALGLLAYANTEAYEVASPTKGFEFAAAGLPFVASPNMMNVEAHRRSGAGYLAEGFSARAIRDAMASALGDEAGWRAAALAGRAWAAREGSWTPSEERLLGLYAEIFSDR